MTSNDLLALHVLALTAAAAAGGDVEPSAPVSVLGMLLRYFRIPQSHLVS
jgi:hypothetical protein